MASSVKTHVETSLKSTVDSLISAYTRQLSTWLSENKEVEISPEELCVAFEVPYKPQTPGVPGGTGIVTQMPNLPNYYSGTGVTTPKKKGGRAKKTHDPNLPPCSYVMARGKSAGQQCTNPIVGDGTTPGGDKYCKACLKKAAVKQELQKSPSKTTVEAPTLPGSVVEVPEEKATKEEELSVIAIDGEEGLYRETTHGFIVQADPTDGSIIALSIDDNGNRRDLRHDEQQIALGMGMRVMSSVPMPETVKTETSEKSETVEIPPVPQVAIPPS